MSSPDQTSGPLRRLYDAYKAGTIDRRQFIECTTMAGAGVAGAMFLANTEQAAASGGSLRNGFAFAAQGASPEAGTAVRPSAGTEGQTRGSGGDLRILQWQAPSLLSPHNATGVKDFLASVLVMEPLMHYLPDATLIPNLITEVPTVENGMLAEDLSSVTYTLIEGVTWSDGTPFTAEDVRFTWQWVLDAEGTYQSTSVNQTVAETITDIEVVDELTARVSFRGPNPLWFENHAGTSTGFVYPKHILETGPDAVQPFLQNPIGTGPYKVESFSPNDQVTYVVNETYRESTKPFFTRVTLKGGGDAASAARAVIQTGEYDFAWNLQVEPDVLEGMVSDGNPGRLVVALGANVERIDINFSDPNTDVTTESVPASPAAGTPAPPAGEVQTFTERSQKDTPHPFFSDPVVREAVSIAINRQQIADSFYEGADGGEPPATNVIEGIEAIQSPNNPLEYDEARANQILDEAGWARDGDIRAKDGVELSIRYATSNNQVRQKTQAVVKQNLEAIGFSVELIGVEAGTYFDSAAGNDQNISHFYWDLEMYQQVPTNPTPLNYMETWYAGENGENIAQASNGWTEDNTSRYNNPEYDALLDQARTETDPEALANLFIQMNDLIIADRATVPLVRVGSKVGVINTLNEENLALGPFSYHYWNIANWNRIA